MRRLGTILTVGMLLSLSGCAMSSYLAHVVAGEAKILLSRSSIEDVLKRKDLTLKRRAQLLMIRDAARDANEVLGLERDGQYMEISRLDDEFNVWVLALAQPDQLTAVTWRFPIAGEVPYLGFFDRDRAVAMANQHYPEMDRYIRTAAGFSTLGYLPDPVLPGVFRLDDVAIVNLIVHELVHATIYIPGNSDWNETVATALGNAGTMVLLKRWGWYREVMQAAQRFEDSRRWAQMIAYSIRTMREAYSQIDEPFLRLAEKEILIEQFKEQVRSAPWHNTAYTEYAAQDLNHAFFLANEVYLANPEFQELVYAQAVSDFSDVLGRLRCVAESDSLDPWVLPDKPCG